MELYNGLTELLREAASGGREYDYIPGDACGKAEKGSIILTKETAFELGGSALPAVSGAMFCGSGEITDGVVLCGKDIGELSSDAPYARFAVISLKDGADEDDDTVYTHLKNAELAKYHVYPKGCLIRLSPESRREQLRVGKKAAAELSLKNIGFSFIEEYKKSELVEAVKIYFFTGSGFDYKKLGELADKASAVTESLNKIMQGLAVSCDTCELKEICDEVDGLRKLHFGKEKQL